MLLSCKHNDDAAQRMDVGREVVASTWRRLEPRQPIGVDAELGEFLHPADAIECVACLASFEIKMDIPAFTQSRIAQITATIGLVSYALLRNRLTPFGIVAGVFVATIHMLHPWPAFFWLLILFFLLGTLVTRVSLSMLGSMKEAWEKSMGHHSKRFLLDANVRRLAIRSRSTLRSQRQAALEAKGPEAPLKSLPTLVQLVCSSRCMRICSRARHLYPHVFPLPPVFMLLG